MENQITTQPNVASIGRRFMAMLLDTLLIAIPATIANHIIPVLGGLLIVFLYAPVLESSEVRATLGKYWMGIQVCDLQGERISFRAACIRYFTKLVSAVFIFLGHAVALFTPKKQAVHDLLADTLVVYGRLEKSLFDSWLDQLKRIFGSEETNARDRLAELEKLQSLRDKGTLTQEEFDQEKQKLLNS